MRTFYQSSSESKRTCFYFAPSPKLFSICHPIWICVWAINSRTVGCEWVFGYLKNSILISIHVLLMEIFRFMRLYFVLRLKRYPFGA